MLHSSGFKEKSIFLRYKNLYICFQVLVCWSIDHLSSFGPAMWHFFVMKTEKYAHLAWIPYKFHTCLFPPHSQLFIWQAHNALLLIRCLLKVFIREMSEEELHLQFSYQERAPGSCGKWWHNSLPGFRSMPVQPQNRDTEEVPGHRHTECHPP